MTRLNTGDRFPDFSLVDDSGSLVTLKDFAGTKLIVYFYPAALTPGCTKQACDFRDTEASWKNEGFSVIGISPDKVEKLQKFRAEENLKFPLLSDPEKSLMASVGAFGEKQLYGKNVVGVIRSTFVLDVDGSGEARVLNAFYNVKATGHVAKLRRDLGL